MKALCKVITVVLAVLMLAIPVSAANFTPSVEQKGAPEIVTTEKTDGTAIVAVIEDPDGQDVHDVTPAEIVVTPVADSKKASKAVRKELEEAYESVSKAKSLDEVVPDLDKALEEHKDAMKEALGGKLDKKVADMKVSDLVVRDLVNVSLTETAANKLKQTGNSVKLMFKMDMKPDDFLMVMRYVDGEWVVMEAEKVEILEDGSVTVQFDEEVGTIAFVVQKSEEIKK